MSAVYTFSEARQNFAGLLERAAQEGEVRIKRRDGRVFVIQPELKTKSPLDVQGINLPISTAEIVQFIHKGRRVVALGGSKKNR